MKEALIIQNGLNIIFPIQPMIRRKANDIEDILSGNYSQPQVISVPDDMDAQIPRLIFTSTHGYSQIVISQVNAALNVKYSPEWQKNFENGKSYLLERIIDLVSISKYFEPSKPLYCGLTTVARIPFNLNDIEIIEMLNTGYSSFSNLNDFHDFHIKYTKYLEDRFFNNMTIKNYRIWEPEQNNPGSLSTESATGRGIEIKNDFNNRYAYNEQKQYSVDINEIQIIIEKGFDSLQQEIQKIKGLN